MQDAVEKWNYGELHEKKIQVIYDCRDRLGEYDKDSLEYCIGNMIPSLGPLLLVIYTKNCPTQSDYTRLTCLTTEQIQAVLESILRANDTRQRLEQFLESRTGPSPSRQIGDVAKIQRPRNYTKGKSNHSNLLLSRANADKRCYRI